MQTHHPLASYYSQSEAKPRQLEMEDMENTKRL